MANRVIKLLQKLREYGLKKKLDLIISYHEEDSHLMRFANSAISLNTNEQLINLDIQAWDGRKRASYSMIVDPADLNAMKKGIDTAAEMVCHAEPLSYEPTFPDFKEDVIDQCSFNRGLSRLSNAECLAYFNKVAKGLESEDLKLAGIFSNGITITAQINTHSPYVQYFSSTDANVTAVISSESLKWEVIALQSAQKKTDLKPALLNRELKLLVRYYQKAKPVRLPLGKYKVVFGPAATGDVVNLLGRWVGTGEAMKRGYSFLTPDMIGTQVLSPQFSLQDNPNRPETYGLSHDQTGLKREPFPIFTDGVFKQFSWAQDEADEYGEKATGHEVPHYSLEIAAGTMSCPDLKALIAMPRDEDILYIPYIHYMNLVNPGKGLLTGSSRFGALLLKKNGRVQVPYNVRLTQSFYDFFGERVEWMSQERVVHDTSSSYGKRNPEAVLVPRFLCVKDIEISHSNTSY